MDSRIPANGNTDQRGNIVPRSPGFKFPINVPAKTLAGMKSIEVNATNKKHMNRFENLFKISKCNISLTS